MGYIGAQPATNFETVRKQVSTTNSGTTITLDFAVSSVQDILVTVNAVVQSYDNYSVSGTTLTLGGTLNNDRVEILYVGRTFQTVTPAIGTVTNDMLVNSSITLNGSAVSLGGSASVDNTPAFQVTLGSNDTISNDTYTKLDFGTETLDTDSAFASGKFTVPSGKDGVYFFSSAITLDGDSSSNLTSGAFRFHKNGSNAGNGVETIFSNNPVRYTSLASSIKISLVAGDYMEIYALINSEDSSGGRVLSGSSFSGMKVIGA